MTIAIDPADKGNLEARAYDAEQSLIRTLDVLAERRLQIRTVLSRARETLKSGALTVSIFLAVGAASMLGRRSRGSRRPSVFARGGALFLLGASVGVLSLALSHPRGGAEDGG